MAAFAVQRGMASGPSEGLLDEVVGMVPSIERAMNIAMFHAAERGEAVGRWSPVGDGVTHQAPAGPGVRYTIVRYQVLTTPRA